MTSLPVFETNSCACSSCKRACQNRPCWGTPDEVEKMLDAGFADKLMLDWWEPDRRTGNRHAVYIVAPAARGYEKRHAPNWPTGVTCTLLTSDQKCPLHDTGYKPLEARVVSHATGLSVSQDVRVFIVKQWMTKRGVALVQRWKNLVGLTS